MGRTKYTPARAQSLLDWLADGKLLIDWCDKNGVSRASVFRWTLDDADFARRFARAKDFGDDILEDEAQRIADTREEDTETLEGESAKGTYSQTRTSDNVARSKLRVETRLKIVARRKGSKVRHELTAAPDALPIRYESSLPDLTPEQVIEIARMAEDEASTDKT